MKSKITGWGNSHGIRITSAMMDHLNVQPGEQVEVNLTGKGIEIIRNKGSVDYLRTVSQEVLDAILEQSRPVKMVEDPYMETDVAYIVVAIDPCAPMTREVSPGTENSYATLADAKEAARQILQTSIAKAQKSLSDLRQLGIDNISYIAL